MPDDDPPNPFDPKRLRLRQPLNGYDVRAALVVSVRKPNSQEFFRTHPDQDMWLTTTLIDVKEERRHYLVLPELAGALSNEVTVKVLVPTATRRGALILWPIRVPDSEGRIDPWNAVAMTAAHRATTRWIRLMPNLGIGTYDVGEAPGALGEPVFADAPLSTLLEVAFADRVIDRLDHPVVRRLKGEI